LNALRALGVRSILTSRPVLEGDSLANEAVVKESGQVRTIHRKQYFSYEPGWHETEWYGTDARDFGTTQLGEISVGVLLYTELMLNGRAQPLLPCHAPLGQLIGRGASRAPWRRSPAAVTW
jgi:N-carbamoylputrescine amidase